MPYYGTTDQKRIARYGLMSGGSGGSSRINVMVTRRFADNEGSSGNSG
jgi:hypothetical protein